MLDVPWITHGLHNTLNIIYTVYIFSRRLLYFTRKHPIFLLLLRKGKADPRPLSRPRKKFRYVRITTRCKAFSRASVSSAALCGRLVNLWSVHACALRALTRDRNVCVPSRPLAPRPQRRTASLPGPMANVIFRGPF